MRAINRSERGRQREDRPFKRSFMWAHKPFTKTTTTTTKAVGYNDWKDVTNIFGKKGDAANGQEMVHLV